jgi:hypothetical protein
MDNTCKRQCRSHVICETWRSCGGEFREEHRIVRRGAAPSKCPQAAYHRQEHPSLGPVIAWVRLLWSPTSAYECPLALPLVTASSPLQFIHALFLGSES